jgi:hypothetical protein
MNDQTLNNQDEKALKICGRCKVAKGLTCFRAQKRGKFGKKSFCIECDDAYNKARYLRTPRKIIAQVTAYKKKNKDKVRAYNQEYGLNWRLKKKGIV